MRYFVLGNINSGKSTFINSLVKELPNYKIYRIDDFRKEYGDSTIKGEEKAQYEFLKCVNKDEDMIVEFSGLGKIEEQIVRTIDHVVFLIDTPLDICLSRIPFKSFNEIPYPKFSEEINDTIIRLDDEINNQKLIEQKWEKYAIGFYRVNKDIKFYPLKQLKLLSKILKLLRENNETIVSYGGLARDELTTKSDLDLFIINSKNKDKIYSKLKSINEYQVYTHTNKVIVINDGIMVEILFVDNIKKIEKFYYYSNVKNVEKTLLNGNVSIEELNKLKASTKYPLIGDIKESAEKLVYTIISFEFELEKDDLYKLWFDSHIIVHELMKLKSYLKGNKDYMYLPKKGYKYFTDSEWKMLDFSIDSDPIEYINNIKPFAKKILKEFTFLNLNINF